MSRRRHQSTRTTLAGALFALAGTESLRACATCYGQSDSPLAQALNWGILSLLVVLLGVLGGVVLFFVHIGRRSAAMERAATASESRITKN